MHVHAIMHDLPHLSYCITALMLQFMFMVFKQTKTLISMKEIKQDKTRQNKTE